MCVCWLRYSAGMVQQGVGVCVCACLFGCCEELRMPDGAC